MVKALFCSTYSTSIVEEEPRAVFLHLFRGGVVFLSFSAFSGRWFELFTVTFRRVQRFYVCKRRLRGQPQLSIMGQESVILLRFLLSRSARTLLKKTAEARENECTLDIERVYSCIV